MSDTVIKKNIMRLNLYYATLTGQTTYIAHVILNYLKRGTSLTVKSCDVSGVSIYELPSLFLFGCSTYGLGDPNPDTELFLEKLTQNNVSLHGAHIALFGLGESVYPDFCKSIDTVASVFEELGANIIHPILKLDMLSDMSVLDHEIDLWTKEITLELSYLVQ